VHRLIGEVYILNKERQGSELHDAKEFSTLLNSCGRYGKADVGLSICCGDRGEALAEGIRLQQNHRGNLAEAIALVKDLGVQRRRYVQWFHGHDEILDSIVGIVAGMVLNSGEVQTDVPMIAFACAEEQKVKVSTRGTREQVNRGLDLALAVKQASEKVGGTGGGHNIAAGATIGMGKEMDFLDAIEDIIRVQMGGPTSSP
jgi:RecJ-like exonuclease